MLAVVLTALSFIPNHLAGCFSGFLGDAVSSLISPLMLFYCLSHPETDFVATKGPDWSLVQKFGEN